MPGFITIFAICRRMRLPLPYLDEVLRDTMQKMSPEIAEKLEYIEDLGQATRLWDKI